MCCKDIVNIASIFSPLPLVNFRISLKNDKDLECDMLSAGMLIFSIRNSLFSKVPTVAKTVHPNCFATLMQACPTALVAA